VLDIPQISALTFDCYGTLVDWEPGILAAIHGVFAQRGITPSADNDLISLYAALEADQERGRYQPYRTILANVMSGIAERHGIRDLTANERNSLAKSLPRWPVFPDTPSFLQRARSKYSLAICSNIDQDLFEGTRPNLGAPIERVITAQACGSYKPNARHFQLALAMLKLPPSRVLHVAESRYHDVEPAKKLGFQTVWVNRHKIRPGPSASGSSDATPDLEVDSLEELAEVLKLEPILGRP
jgi:2-haloacid dehalogenase